MSNWVDNKIICEQSLFDRHLRTTVHQDCQRGQAVISMRKFHEEFPEYDLGDHQEDEYCCTCKHLGNGMIEILFSTRNEVPIKFAVSLIRQFRNNTAYYFIEENEIYISRLVWKEDTVREEVFLLENCEEYQQYSEKVSAKYDDYYLVWRWRVTGRQGWILSKDTDILERYGDRRPEDWIYPDAVKDMETLLEHQQEEKQNSIRSLIKDLYGSRAGIFLELEIINDVKARMKDERWDAAGQVNRLVSEGFLVMLKDNANEIMRVLARQDNPILFSRGSFCYSAKFACPEAEPVLNLSLQDVRKWLETHTSEQSYASAFASVDAENTVLDFENGVYMMSPHNEQDRKNWSAFQKEMRSTILRLNGASARQYGMYSENMIIEDFMMRNGFGKSAGWWILPGSGECVCLRMPIRVKYTGSSCMLKNGQEYEVEDMNDQFYDVVNDENEEDLFPASDFEIAELSLDYNQK